MELLPLLIIVGGILYSVVTSSAKKKGEGKRNIDPSKLERRGNSAPRRRQPEARGNDTSESKGFFGDIKREFKREYEKAMGTDEARPETSQQDSRQNRSETSQRMQQEAEKRAREYQRPNRRDTETTRTTREPRSKHSQRAQESKKAAYSEGYRREENPKKVERSTGIGGEIIDKVRSQSGDNNTKTHKSKNRKKSASFTKDDISFDQRAVVNGIIFSEILGKPKSKR